MNKVIADERNSRTQSLRAIDQGLAHVLYLED